MTANGTLNNKKKLRGNSIANPPLEKDTYVGSWLCERGPYQEYIEALCRSNSSLRKADPANKDTPLKNGNAMVALLDAPASGPPNFDAQDFKSISDLKKHFENNRSNNGAHDRRRIYIMEGLAPDYVAAIGGHFFMDPSFFQRQERTCVWSNDFTPTSDALPPPTSLDPEKSFHLQYCELRQFNASMPNQPFFCARTGRHVGMTAARTKNETSTVAIVRRKISWWSRKTSRGGWDVVILCDPQLGELRPVPKRLPEDFENKAFQEGYVDFIPPPTPERAASAPEHPHHSVLKDLCYYYKHHWDLIEDSEWTKPTTSSLFLKKVVAAHYLQLIDYIKAMLPSLELRLTTAWVDEQEQWKSLQTISRRCGNYRDDIEDTLLSLGYPLDAFQPRTGPDWKDCQRDFQYIYFRLKILKQRADTLMQSMTGLASIAGNRQNLEEAKRVKRLNLLALLFIPLAYTASLFSMQDNFMPGNAKFWIYWVSALGVVGLTLFATWLLDSALDDAAQWKLGPLKWLRDWYAETKDQAGELKRTKTIHYWVGKQ